jgi:hypothetical protein
MMPHKEHQCGRKRRELQLVSHYYLMPPMMSVVVIRLMEQLLQRRQSMHLDD